MARPVMDSLPFSMLCGRTAPQVDSVSERARKLADRRTPGYDALLAREIVAEACKAELETHGIDLWVEEPNDGGIEMHGMTEARKGAPRLLGAPLGICCYV